MNRFILPVLAIGAGLILSGCSALEPVETRTFDLADFNSVSASDGVDIVLSQGPFAVKAEGPKSKLENLTVERKGAELVVGRETTYSWGTWSQRDIVTITAPTLARISASNGSDVEGQDLKLENIRISANGGADFNLSGSCKALDLNISSGSDFSGKNFICETVAIDASSGSDGSITATRDASVRGKGGADLHIYGVTGSAMGDASSGSDIRFHGAPASFQKDESGGGDVDVVED